MLSRQGHGPPGTTVSVGRGDGTAKTVRFRPSCLAPLPACYSEEMVTEPRVGE